MCALLTLCSGACIRQAASASAGEAVTQDGLDKRCEMWLERIFGLRLDFAIENSLPVCLEDGVIERDDQVSSFSVLHAVIYLAELCFAPYI